MDCLGKKNGAVLGGIQLYGELSKGDDRLGYNSPRRSFGLEDALDGGTLIGFELHEYLEGTLGVWSE